MAVELYLIRHGIAVERGTYARDGDRPLTAAGEMKTKAVAKRLNALGIQFDVLLSSPLVRAYQTATLLMDAGLASVLEESDDLAPEGDLTAWCTWLGEWLERNPTTQSIGLVGHEPDLGEWAERLVWGEVRHRLIVKKAGIIGIAIAQPSQPIGTSELFWLSPPRLLL